jgi:XdhC Rossmann domain
MKIALRSRSASPTTLSGVTETPVDACAVAHGDAPAHEDGTRTLVVVFTNPVADLLLHLAHDVGFRTILVGPMLRDLGVADADIQRVHRPIGLNIGSRTPGEIAVSTLAGLIADRNDRPGGFDF